MGEKSSVMMRPVLWNSDPAVVELRTGRGIKCESCPKANQDQHQRHHLGSHPRESQQKQEYVTQSDLRKCVLKCEVSLRRPQRAKKDSEKNQQQRASGRMRQHVSESLSLHFPARDRKRERRANQKRKA